MRVLVFCPLNPKYPRLYGQTVQAIFRLEWQKPIDWFFVANDNPLGQPYENITYNYNRARQACIDGKYDALLCVESDMIIPKDALRRLVQCDADIAYGLYVWRHGRRFWSAYTEVGELRGKSISEDADTARSLFGQRLTVAGVGLGCTLIYRDVLEQIPFRLYPDRVTAVSCDWLLAVDAQERGLIQVCDLGCVCGHISYLPFPQIIWPDPNAERLERIEPMPGVTFEKEPLNGMKVYAGMGQTVAYRAGEDG